MIILTVARSTFHYIIGRVLQGIATSFVQVIALALVADTVEKDEIGQMFGYIGGATSRKLIISV